jgi:hypothetical protein
VKGISERFISQYGKEALTSYATISMLKAEGKSPLGWDPVSSKTVNYNFLDKRGLKEITASQWDEVVCEIVATYGRRGQFNKIKELFETR